jgi:hypothetical protein
MIVLELAVHMDFDMSFFSDLTFFEDDEFLSPFCFERIMLREAHLKAWKEDQGGEHPTVDTIYRKIAVAENLQGPQADTRVRELQAYAVRYTTKVITYYRKMYTGGYHGQATPKLAHVMRTFKAWRLLHPGRHAMLEQDIQVHSPPFPFSWVLSNVAFSLCRTEIWTRLYTSRSRTRNPWSSKCRPTWPLPPRAKP